MLVSIITPTHSFKYLPELYQTLCEQTYLNWEWVLYINGTALNETLPDVMQNDKRVKCFIDTTGNKNVGYLKNRAFTLGSGDVLIEMDHDDLLVDTCLEKVVDVFKSDSEIGFVSSDDAILKTDGEFVPYNPSCGWTFKEFEYKGKKLISMNCFKPDAASMAFIWYMPNHIRCWRASVYKDVGGHDISLSVLDDQDLIARTYLKTKFHHIHEPLYIYRIYGQNTWLQNGEYIQRETVEMYKKYGYQLAERDADLKKLLKIDLGGGIDARAGYITIDQEGGDITCDLNNGIPLPDNSVGVINASHLLEHLKDPLKIMSEIHRVLADGGWAFIDVPSTDGRGAWQDPTHISYWNQNSFLYYTNVNQARFIRNDKIRFQEFRRETIYYNNWWKENNIPVVVAWLRAIKTNARRPHPINI